MAAAIIRKLVAYGMLPMKINILFRLFNGGAPPLFYAR